MNIVVNEKGIKNVDSNAMKSIIFLFMDWDKLKGSSSK